MSEREDPKLPDYHTPPVIEVVCGVYFRPLERLLAPHIGQLWDEFRSDYPGCEEVAPIVPRVEQFEGQPSIELELSAKPPLPRIWFVSQDQNMLIQLQRNCFLHNWRKTQGTDEYPHYERVISAFRNQLERFIEFLRTANVGEMHATQLEMTYINHIPCGDGWKVTGDIGDLFPDFSWRDTERFLPQPDGMNWKTRFAIPGENSRLHTSIGAARRRDNTNVILFELTTRGKPRSEDSASFWPWFDMAREWIVRGFADLTSPETQKTVWRRFP